MLHQGIAILGQIGDGITSQFHGFQDFDSALRGIQPNPIAQTPIPVGVIGKDNGHFPLRRRRSAQSRPVRGEIRHEIDPALLWLVADDVGLNPFIIASG